MPHPSPISRAATPADHRWLGAIGGVLAAVLLLLVLAACGHGIEFSDEGFYLLWIAQPQHYPAIVTHFGFLYHPLYELLGGGIVRLRQVNLLLLFGLAYTLCQSLLRDLPYKRGLTVIYASLIVMFYTLWLPTPSYNSLTLQGLLVASLGILIITRQPFSRSGWVVLAVGGWLTFMGKPTSAAALAVLVAAYLILGHRWKTRYLLLSAVVAGLLLAVSAVSFYGAPQTLITRMQSGLHLAEMLSSHHGAGEMLRWDAIAYTPASAGMLMLALPLLALLCRPARHAFPLALFFIALPYVYAFGTSNNYWEQASKAAFFWALAALPLLLRTPVKIHLRGLLLLGIAAQILTLVLVWHSIAQPYRQPSAVLSQRASIQLPRTATLQVSDEAARYVQTLHTMAEGFAANTPLIDLTGHSPAVAYLLGGRAVGQPWLLGGYAGSAKFSRAVLGLADCASLARAWVLSEPKGARHISASLLHSYGADLGTDYRKVGSLPALSVTSQPGTMQHLYRPTRSAAAARRACEARR